MHTVSVAAFSVFNIFPFDLWPVVLQSHMAASKLDAVVQAENEKAKAAKMEKLSKPRLVADPSVSAKEIMGAIRNFVNVKETKDLYSLVAPGGFRTMSWQSQVDSDWLLKVAALCYDILEFAPNSKLQGKKVSEALKKLLDGGDIINGSQKNERDFIDSCSTLIRVALAQFRTLKIDLQKRDSVLRKLVLMDKKRIYHIIERMQLPPMYDDTNTDDENEVELGSSSKNKPAPREELGLVVADTSMTMTHLSSSGSKGTLDTSMDVFEDVLAGNSSQHVYAPRTPPDSGSNFSKIVAGFESGEKRKVRASVGLTMSTASLESPFRGNQPGNVAKVSLKHAKEMVHGDGKEMKMKAKGTSSRSKSFDISDQDLVDEAMNHVPSMASPVLKKPAAKLKRPAAVLKQDHQDDSKTHEDEPKTFKRPASMKPVHEDGSASAPSAVSRSKHYANFVTQEPACIYIYIYIPPKPACIFPQFS